ncbi:MAG: phosphatidylglycerophosphatase A [Candidatus Omnitrophota bacterium]
MVKEQKAGPTQTFFIKLITTFFFVGYLPLIPGTFGSVAGLLIYLVSGKSFYLLLFVTFLVLILGFSLSGRAAKLFSRRDPPQIVIDEIAGMLISFLAIPGGHDKVTLLLGFMIFRIIDTLKPYPANRFQLIEGGLGIMGDDIIAGLYTNFILRLIFLLKYSSCSI